MGGFDLSLPPRYGLHPQTNEQYWPSEGNGFGGYEFLARQWCEAAYEEAKLDNQASKEAQEIQTQIDYISGKQWSGRRPTYKASPIDNRMFGLFWELVSHLTDIRPVANVKPIADDTSEYISCGNMLNNCMKSWWLDTDADQALSMVVANGLLSTSYGKLQWNPRRDNGAGNFEILPYGINNVLPLKPGMFLRDAQAIILEEPKSLSDLKMIFPLRGPLVQPDADLSRQMSSPQKPANVPGRYFEALSPQMKQIVGTTVRPTQSVYPSALYREYWIKDRQVNNSGRVVMMGDPGTSWCYAVKPGQPLYPRGRLIVTAGKTILHDGPNPYWHGEFPFGDLRLNMVPWQFHSLCYSDDTEVLTRRGWIKFSDSREDDEFATRNPSTKEFEWQRPIRLTKEQYRGEMYHFFSRCMDICVTPEHRMLVDRLPRKMGGKKGTAGEHVIRARELAENGTHHVKIPQTSVWNGFEIRERVFKTGHYYDKPVVMNGHQYCSFMGAFLAEGWVSTPKTEVLICQHKKSKGYEPYRSLLKSIFKKEPRWDGKNFVVSRTGLARFCSQFGNCSQKYIPDDIMNSSVSQLKAFWDSYILGDGSLKKRENKVRKIRPGEEFEQKASTVSKRLADQLVEVAQKIGWSASVAEYPAKVTMKKNGKPMYHQKKYEIVVRFSKSMSVRHKKLDYDGWIYCATVPNGMLYVRRNGKPAWCGNSEVKPWISLQDIINNILAGVLDMVKKIVNPIFMGPKNAFSDSLWSALDWGMPGAKAGYNQNIAHKPEFGPTPQIPAIILQLFALAAKEMDRSSGIAAVSEAMHKKQVPAGDAMTQVQRAQQQPIRLKGRQIEILLRQFGRQSISNIMQFYPNNRIMYLAGQKGKFNAEKYDSSKLRALADQSVPQSDTAMSPVDRLRELSKHFVFLIQPGSLLDLNRVERSALVVRLRLMKDIDRRTLYDELDLGVDIDAIEARLKQEAAEMGAMMQRAKMPQMAHGQGRGVPRQPR